MMPFHMLRYVNLCLNVLSTHQTHRHVGDYDNSTNLCCGLNGPICLKSVNHCSFYVESLKNIAFVDLAACQPCNVYVVFVFETWGGGALC